VAQKKKGKKSGVLLSLKHFPGRRSIEEKKKGRGEKEERGNAHSPIFLILPSLPASPDGERRKRKPFSS